jgi:hypothetical protein
MHVVFLASFIAMLPISHKARAVAVATSVTPDVVVIFPPPEGCLVCRTSDLLELSRRVRIGKACPWFRIRHLPQNLLSAGRLYSVTKPPNCSSLNIRIFTLYTEKLFL